VVTLIQDELIIQDITKLKNFMRRMLKEFKGEHEKIHADKFVNEILKIGLDGFEETHRIVNFA
jgi:hypothetical protein